LVVGVAAGRFAPDALGHRIVLTFEAEAESLSTDDVVARVLDAVKAP
jgi:MoxR-like ATPase